MPSKRNLRTLLAGRGFRRLLTVRLASQFGDGLFSGALAGTILFNPDQQADPVAIATGFAVLLLPYSVLGPYVGVFLDRWPRRHVLAYGNLVRAALAIPVGVLVATGHSVPTFILLALLVTGINRFILAGHSAAMPHVIDGPRLLTGNALAPTLGTVANSLGLGATALVHRMVDAGSGGYALLAELAAIGYLVSALLARGWFRPDALGPNETELRTGPIVTELVIVARGMVAGLRHLAARPGSATLLGAQSAYRVLYGVLTVAGLLLYRNYFSTDAQYDQSILGLAQLVVSGGVGSFLGAAITPPAARRLGDRNWVALILAAAGALIVALGAPFVSALLVIAVLGINVASQGTKIITDTTIQRECADEYRGRVFSVNDTSYNVCWVLGLYLGAEFLPPNGHSLAGVLVVGLGYAAVGVGYRLLSGWLTRRTPVPLEV